MQIPYMLYGKITSRDFPSGFLHYSDGLWILDTESTRSTTQDNSIYIPRVYESPDFEEMWGWAYQRHGRIYLRPSARAQLQSEGIDVTELLGESAMPQQPNPLVSRLRSFVSEISNGARLWGMKQAKKRDAKSPVRPGHADMSMKESAIGLAGGAPVVSPAVPEARYQCCVPVTGEIRGEVIAKLRELGGGICYPTSSRNYRDSQGFTQAQDLSAHFPTKESRTDFEVWYNAQQFEDDAGDELWMLSESMRLRLKMRAALREDRCGTFEVCVNQAWRQAAGVALDKLRFVDIEDSAYTHNNTKFSFYVVAPEEIAGAVATAFHNAGMGSHDFTIRPVRSAGGE